MEIPNDILKRISERKQHSNTYLASICEPYLKHFQYSNETLEKDLKVFWITVYKKRNEAKIKEILEWAKKKELHVKQVIKALQ